MDNMYVLKRVTDVVVNDFDKSAIITLEDGTTRAWTHTDYEASGGNPPRVGDMYRELAPAAEYEPGEPNPLLNSPVQAEPEPLPAHVQRMVDEFAELNQRIEKLVAFLETPLFASQPEYDRVLMYTQLGQMQGYAGVLALRLNRAGA